MCYGTFFMLSDLYIRTRSRAIKLRLLRLLSHWERENERWKKFSLWTLTAPMWNCHTFSLNPPLSLSRSMCVFNRIHIHTHIWQRRDFFDFSSSKNCFPSPPSPPDGEHSPMTTWLIVAENAHFTIILEHNAYTHTHIKTDGGGETATQNSKSDFQFMHTHFIRQSCDDKSVKMWWAVTQ